MECRAQCGMCCIAPSINEPLPGMPDGKRAGEYCINLDPDSLACRIWGTADYPSLCRDFRPAPDTCGNSRDQAEELIRWLEVATQPGL